MVEWKDIDMKPKGPLSFQEFYNRYCNLEYPVTPVNLIATIVKSLDSLSLDCEVEQGDIVEIVEFLCVEQNKWIENSVGWKVLESLKDYIRLNKDDWTNTPESIKENLS